MEEKAIRRHPQTGELRVYGDELLYGKDGVPLIILPPFEEWIRSKEVLGRVDIRPRRAGEHDYSRS